MLSSPGPIIVLVQVKNRSSLHCLTDRELVICTENYTLSTLSYSFLSWTEPNSSIVMVRTLLKARIFYFSKPATVRVSTGTLSEQLRVVPDLTKN